MTESAAAGPLTRIVSRVAVAVASVCLVLGAISAYRAWVQVYSLALIVPAGTLAPGTVVRVEAVTSGRTPVDLELVLEQGDRAETLGAWLLHDNRDAAMDPRPRRAEHEVVVSDGQLTAFASGGAALRVTATGRHQWLRLPPPTVRRQTVMIER